MLLTACASTPASAQCDMDERDRAWLAQALETWRGAEPRWLGLAPQPLPTVAAVDGECTYLLLRGEFKGMTAEPHSGVATLPDGAEVPLGPISFASGEGGYFAMSLPSVWRAAGVESELGLEQM